MVYSDGLVCVECGFAIAYGADSVESPPDGWRARWDRFTVQLERDAVSVVNGDSDDNRAFSRQACDYCHSPLGGARMAVVFSWVES